MKPTIGRLVHYRITAPEAESMNKRRSDYRAFAMSHAHPHEAGTAPAAAHVAHIGNSLSDGEYYPAMVVRTALSPDTVNLQVFLDGNDTLWATSVKEGDEPGTWAWPPQCQAAQKDETTPDGKDAEPEQSQPAAEPDTDVNPEPEADTAAQPDTSEG